MITISVSVYSFYSRNGINRYYAQLMNILHIHAFFFFFKLWESGHHEMNQILCPIYLSNQDPQHTPVLFSDPCPAFLHPLPKFPDVGRQSGRREERHLHFLRYCKQLSPSNCAFP